MILQITGVALELRAAAAQVDPLYLGLVAAQEVVDDARRLADPLIDERRDGHMALGIVLSVEEIALGLVGLGGQRVHLAVLGVISVSRFPPVVTILLTKNRPS